MYKLDNILLNSSWVKADITKKIKTYFEMSENTNNVLKLTGDC